MRACDSITMLPLSCNSASSFRTRSCLARENFIAFPNRSRNRRRPIRWRLTQSAECA